MCQYEVYKIIESVWDNVNNNSREYEYLKRRKFKKKKTKRMKQWRKLKNVYKC